MNRHAVLMPGDAETVAAHAVRVNVFHTIDFLLKYSAPIREKVKNGQLEIQGAEETKEFYGIFMFHSTWGWPPSCNLRRDY